MILEQVEGLALSNQFLGYVILGLSAFLENIIPPVPGDTVTVFGAFLIGRGILEWEWVLVSTTLGSTGGFMGLYLISYYLSSRFLGREEGKIFSKDLIERGNEWINRYGYWVIIGNRFLAGLRSVISISAGLAKLNKYKVLVLSLISALIWNGVLLYFGYQAGNHWNIVIGVVNQYSPNIIYNFWVIDNGVNFKIFNIKEKRQEKIIRIREEVDLFFQNQERG